MIKKLTFSSHIINLRTKCEKALNILKVLSNTSWGADRNTMLRIYKATILSKMDYGCEVYGSARKSVLKKLDTVHHAGIRISLGAFRTSPVTSLYVEGFELPLDLRRKKLSLFYYFKTHSNPDHPFYNFKLSLFLQRLQSARPYLIPSFFMRMKNLLSDLDLSSIKIAPHQHHILPPWKTPHFILLNPFLNFCKSDTSDIIYRKLFLSHRQQYGNFTPIFTDGSKSRNSVSFAFVLNDSSVSHKLHPVCTIFTAEIMAIIQALHTISTLPPGKFIIYSDSLSILQSLHSCNFTNHPLLFKIFESYENLTFRGFLIMFCWVPSHVGIHGNELADKAAKAAAVFNCHVPLNDVKRHISSIFHFIWQKHWDSESHNKLHYIKPIISNWPVPHLRKHDTILTRLRIGHTRFTHKYLFLGEATPVCQNCSLPMSVKHILEDCPDFAAQRFKFFNQHHIPLRDLLNEQPHENIFIFLKCIGFYSLI